MPHAASSVPSFPRRPGPYARVVDRVVPPAEPRSTEDGRIVETWPPLPTKREVPNYRIHAIERFVLESRGLGARSLPTAAPLLALICWLYDHGLPMPTRERAAEWVGTTSKDSIDVAISTALGEFELREEYQTFRGQVDGRRSATRRRYLIPSEELFAVYQSARV